MLSILEASVHHVDIVPVGVRVPVAATKQGMGRPLDRRCPNSPAESEWKTSNIKLN